MKTLWSVLLITSIFTCYGFRMIHESIRRKSIIRYQERFYNYDVPIATTKKTVGEKENTLIVLVSGTIGADSKEFYLRDGHYRQIFPLGVSGHFNPIYESEKGQFNTEITWLPTEIFDDLAKDNFHVLKKGQTIRAMGTLIANQFIDQRTGEDRRCIRFRILKLLKEHEFEEMKRITQLTASSFQRDTSDDMHKEAESVITTPETVSSTSVFESTKRENAFPSTIKRKSSKTKMQQTFEPEHQEIEVVSHQTIRSVSNSSNDSVDENAQSLPPTIIRKKVKGKVEKQNFDNFPPRQPTQFLKPDETTISSENPFNYLSPAISSPANMTSSADLLDDETGWESVELQAKRRNFR